jgi:hypothetical protein
MRSIFLVCALSLSAAATAQDYQTLSRGDGTWAVLDDGSWHVLAGPEESKAQTLTTVVPDPDYPDQPWTVETPRRDKEPMDVFIRRHDRLVQAVRDHLDR